MRLPWAGLLIAFFFALMVFFGWVVKDPYRFHIICAEDGIVEYMQFAAYFLAAVSAGYIVFRFYKRKDIYNTIAFGVLSLFLFFVAMEEISWGQRIFNVATPESIKKINSQNEITFHNVGLFQQLMFELYVAIGAAGILACALWFMPKLRKLKMLRYIAMHPAILPFFIPIFVYGIYRVHVGQWSELRKTLSFDEVKYISLYQEPVELMLALGFLFYTITIHFQQKKQAHVSNCANRGTV